MSLTFSSKENNRYKYKIYTKHPLLLIDLVWRNNENKTVNRGESNMATGTQPQTV
jgi:hypothetical protein